VACPPALELTNLDQPVQLAGDGGVPVGHHVPVAHGRHGGGVPSRYITPRRGAHLGRDGATRDGPSMRLA
jgi:hypothetical protein